jgi:RNA polymerase sigma-70 factor (ECF subfamily)
MPVGENIYTFVTKCNLMGLIYRQVKKVDFEELYDQYADDVYHFTLSLCGNPHIAEEITSETFIKAIGSIDKFKGKCTLKSWLCQIAKNTFYTDAEKRKRFTELDGNIPCESFEIMFIEKASAFKIHKLLHVLSEPYKEVFSLRIFGELSFAEIGELFEKSESWARVTYHRAKFKLREMYENG